MDNHDAENVIVPDNQNDSMPQLDEVVIKKSAGMWFNRTGGACCIHFAINTIISIIIMMFFSIRGAMRGMNQDEILKSMQSGENLLWTVAITYIVSNILGAIICLAFIKKLRNSVKLMFSKPQLSLKYIFLGIPAAMFIQTVSMFLQTLFVSVSGSSGMENMEMPDFIKGNLTNNILLVVYVVFLGPVTEELLFRGAIMKGFNFVSRKFAIILSAAMFAIFHGNILQAIIAFLLGVFFGYIDMKAGSIIPSVVLHITNNAIGTALSYIQYKTGEELSDRFMIIYAVCTLVIGLLCLIILMRNLKDKEMSDSVFFTSRIQADKDLISKCGIKAAVKCPLLWINIIIYSVLIIINI